MTSPPKRWSGHGSPTVWSAGASGARLQVRGGGRRRRGGMRASPLEAGQRFSLSDHPQMQAMCSKAGCCGAVAEPAQLHVRPPTASPTFLLGTLPDFECAVIAAGHHAPPLGVKCNVPHRGVMPHPRPCSWRGRERQMRASTCDRAKRFLLLLSTSEHLHASAALPTAPLSSRRCQ